MSCAYLECLQIPLEPGDHFCHLCLLPRHRDDVVLESLIIEVELGQGIVINARVHFTFQKTNVKPSRHMQYGRHGADRMGRNRILVWWLLLKQSCVYLALVLWHQSQMD